MNVTALVAIGQCINKHILFFLDEVYALSDKPGISTTTTATIDFRYIVVIYDYLVHKHNNHNDKTVRFALTKSPPYLIRCGVSFVNYTKKNDRDKSRACSNISSSFMALYSSSDPNDIFYLYVDHNAKVDQFVYHYCVINDPPVAQRSISSCPLTLWTFAAIIHMEGLTTGK